jgi:hypothetical protein
MAVYTVKEYIEILKPDIGVRGYRMLLHAAVEENLEVLAEAAIADSIDLGGDAVEFPT